MPGLRTAVHCALRLQGGQLHSHLHPYGSSDFEHVKAELSDGVLTLVVPKSERVQSRRISLFRLEESLRESEEEPKGA